MTLLTFIQSNKFIMITIIFTIIDTGTYIHKFICLGGSKKATLKADVDPPWYGTMKITMFLIVNDRSGYREKNSYSNHRY